MEYPEVWKATIVWMCGDISVHRVQSEDEAQWLAAFAMRFVAAVSDAYISVGTM